MMESLSPSAVSSGASSWRHYVSIARPDHWFKNAFLLPGVALALMLSGEPLRAALTLQVLAALLATCLIASANYTINEWLDAEFDRFHPTKHARPAASTQMSASLVYTQWLGLACIGLIIGYLINMRVLQYEIALLVMGLVYNVRPLRTKERPYLDVLSEAINNPIRLMIGWSVIVQIVAPPSSVLISYWMGGAYLMAVKRFSEYRFIGDPNRAGLYRRSFLFYNENSLLLSAFFYGMCSSTFLGIFLIKYRIEFILGLPLLVILFVWYLAIGMRHDSVAQRTEKLYTEWKLMAFVAMLVACFTALLFIDIPALDFLVSYHVLDK
ncbi:MAG TPA: UbiA prenyltransferase family protein [Methylocella sp.]|nr:UbiA prenyltransferase family protein [Methylocella sp.]